MKTKLAVFSEKIIEAGWLIAVVAVPLFFNIYSARTFEPDKITLLRSLVAVMVVAWIISVVEQGRDSAGNAATISFADRVRRWLKLPLFLPTLLLVFVYMLSTIFSISPNVSLWGSYQRMQGSYTMLSYIVIFALMAGHLRTRQQVERLVSTIIVASIPISLYGIVQRYGLDPLPWAGDVVTRVAANMGNAIFVASYLIMVVPLTLSRLIESMSAIIKEEEASWGHTVLSAVYIFALAVQLLTIAFTQSRGPMLGLFGALFVMGLLLILILRRLHSNSSGLSVTEFASGMVLIVPLGLAAGIVGGAGYLVGIGLQKLLVALNYQLDYLPMLGAALGGLLGFVGLYVYMAVTRQGWRWLWVSWLGIAVLGVGLVLLLNLRSTGFDSYLNPVRQLPVLDRLSRVMITESGTGKVRVLIWDAAMELIAPHEPLGIAEDEMLSLDRFNVLRPIIGYGPESMFNAFAYVYPPGLAHVEARGSSADRSHNETMDSLVITGAFGFLAFYYLMVSLFYYALRWLGWAEDRASRRRAIIFMILGGIGGAVLAYLLQGGVTFVPLGLPIGVIGGLIFHLVWQGFARQPANPAGAIGDIETPPSDLSTTAQAGTEKTVDLSDYSLLLIGLLGAFIGHFIEVHFVFSIAATYTYFWIYAGLMVALAMMGRTAPRSVDEPETQSGESVQVEPKEAAAPEPKRQSPRRKSRVRRAARRKKSVPAAEMGHASGTITTAVARTERWETWVVGQGLAMAIILIILAFDFITPRFEFQWADKDSMSLLWIFVITWLAGLTITLSEVAIWQNHKEKVSASWISGLTWGPSLKNILIDVGAFLFCMVVLLLFSLLFPNLHWILIILQIIIALGFTLALGIVLSRKYPVPITIYGLTSLTTSLSIYASIHRYQFGRQIAVTSLDDVITAANILTYGLLILYIFLFLLMIFFAIMLSWRQMARLPLWRADIVNALVYLVLIVAMVGVVGLKNIDVVRADMYLKEGDRYRNSRQWDQAIVLHEKARSIDPDEDFYYLMLALDYQLMAQDQNLDPTRRQLAWKEGERIALEARRINPYNPDNTGNMGRYYFTLGQVFDPQYFADALRYFRKATTLAPSNILYHNLWAQTHYIRQDYDSAIDRLEKSLEIDPRYPPTWLLLGDTYAATGDVDEALDAHSKAMGLVVRGSDGFLIFADQFLDQRLNFYISAGRVEDMGAAMQQIAVNRPADARIPLAIGRAYTLAGELEKALPYLKQARVLGNESDRLSRELANTYLNLRRFDEAIPNYELILQRNPDDVEAHSGLAYIYAQQGRLDEAIAENQMVLQLIPNDYDSLKNLAILYQQRSQWREALEAAQQAEAVAPDAEKPSWQQFIADLEQQIAATG